MCQVRVIVRADFLFQAVITDIRGDIEDAGVVAEAISKVFVLKIIRPRLCGLIPAEEGDSARGEEEGDNYTDLES